MSEEQRRTQKFMKEFLKWREEAWGHWLGAGFMVAMMLIFSLWTVQGVIEKPIIGRPDYSLLLMLGLIAPLAGRVYLQPYTQYQEGATKTTILTRLKYLPIDYAQIRKMKVIYLVKFYAKLLPFSMVLQLLVAYASYGYIEWMNVAYILLMYFVWPLVVNIPIVYLDK